MKRRIFTTDYTDGTDKEKIGHVGEAKSQRPARVGSWFFFTQVALLVFSFLSVASV
jgi:hypothetical protein